ncbi:MAG: DUF4271 domain-containing protein [Bacteroidales bacterium]|nr:DUF4271 domain-containing protein [Bacteroidales bacterium]MDD2204955.1 DUF4271 domain-containing protein [Bacteroidales bacterium]MDD3913896.1 DUF4271 domain-containing protein [Bacteroidales bacterium]MDD4634264.1 DUF4271 domain-containing protein [Bacteroidales bacterium]
MSERLIFSHSTGDLFFCILALSLAVIAFIIYNYNSRMKDAFSAMIMPTGMNQLLRDGTFVNESISILMQLIYTVTTSMFYIELLHYLNYSYFGLSNKMLWMIVVSIVFLLPLLKRFMLLIFGDLYKVKNSCLQFSITNVLYNFSAGMLLIPILFFITYSKAYYMFYVAGIILLINYLLCFFRMILIGFSDQKLSNIYFIFYLCTLKILPAVVIYTFVIRCS